MSRKLIIGNWKMNGSLASNEALVRALVGAGLAEKPVDCAVCPPSVYLAQLAGLLQGSSLMLGAQTVHARESGAFTGDVSAAMLAELGCKLVLVGHSERRAGHGESSEQVAAQALAAVRAGLTPVVCVGESADDHDAGMMQDAVTAQLAPLAAANAEADGSLLEKLVIAYEPVWAIGSGEAATPQYVSVVLECIREWVSEAAPALTEENLPRVLYGGSVRPGNAGELLSLHACGGLLVGGAALVAEEFIAICTAAAAQA